jgi:hypothetical protein
MADARRRRAHVRVFVNDELGDADNEEAWMFRRLIERTQERYYIYMPRSAHMWLTGLLFICIGLVALPALALSKASIYALAPLFMLQLVPAVALLFQATGKAAVDEVVDGVYYWLTKEQHSMPIMYAAIGAAGFALAGLGLASSAYVHCPGTYDSNDSLAQFITGADASAAALAPTLPTLLELWRRPDFASELALFQACLDDRPLVLATMVIAAALVLLDIGVVVLIAWARKRSVDFEIDFAEDEADAGNDDEDTGAAADADTAEMTPAGGLGNLRRRLATPQVRGYLFAPRSFDK